MKSEQPYSPRKIYDCHCHIYPEGISHRAVQSVEQFYDGLPCEPLDGTPETLFESGRSCGISRFVTLAVATRPDQVSHINRFMGACQADGGGVIVGLGTLHPFSPQPGKDLEELLALGLKGVKLHPDIQQFACDDPKAMHIYELCEAHSLPVYLHTGDYRYDFSNPGRVRNILEAFPHLTVIGAHLGGWSVWDEAASLAEYPNLMVDTSSCFFWLGTEKSREMICLFGADRVMFGTDYPMWKPEPEIRSLLALDLTDEEYDNIFWKNCGKLFSIE